MNKVGKRATNPDQDKVHTVQPMEAGDHAKENESPDQDTMQSTNSEGDQEVKTKKRDQNYGKKPHSTT